MRVGIVSDLHQGYSHGSRVIADGPMAGTNAREADFISAAWDAITNLKAQNVELIIDGGDMAHVPAPKKRAIQALIDLIRYAEVPFYSADGNHTSLKGSSDIHLYDILSSETPNFFGAISAQVFDHEGYKIGLVPHSYTPEVTIERVQGILDASPDILVGHWAASDIQYDSAQVPLEYLPASIPVFLGHYHRHVEQRSPLPNYIGSTERTAWDQWDYPTGATLFDTKTGKIEHILHKTRPFVNLEATGEDYLEALDREDLEDAVVRLTVTTDRHTYGTLRLAEAKRKAYALGALAYHHRRAKDKNSSESSVETYESRPLNDAWTDYAKDNRLAKRVIELGREALDV